MWFLACTIPQLSPPAQVSSKGVPPPADTAGPPAAPCLNEWMVANEAAFVLLDGSRPDWVELANPHDEDFSLDGWGITDNPEKTHKHAFDPDLLIPAGGYLLLYASGDRTLGEKHLGFRLASEGGVLGLFGPNDDGNLVTYGRVEDDFSIARSSDCCTEEGCLEHAFRGTPGFNNQAKEPPAEALVYHQSTWSYLDSGTYPGNGWQGAAFDDSTWSTGPAPLGFGDEHLTTTINGGPEGARHVSTWLRLVFQVSDAAELTSLHADLMVDDGVQIWLNEEPMLQVNLPPSSDAFTWAKGSVSDQNETLSVRYHLDPTLVVEGENVLAVELHQATATSSDLGFDLRLVATR